MVMDTLTECLFLQHQQTLKTKPKKVFTQFTNMVEGSQSHIQDGRGHGRPLLLAWFQPAWTNIFRFPSRPCLGQCHKSFGHLGTPAFVPWYGILISAPYLVPQPYILSVLGSLMLSPISLSLKKENTQFRMNRLITLPCPSRLFTYGKLLDDFVRFLWMLANSASTNSRLSQPSSQDFADPSPDSFAA
jgi:hypothetical protein